MRRPQLQTLFVSRYERIRPKAYHWLTRIRIDAATRSIERYKLVCFGPYWLMTSKTRSPVTAQASVLMVLSGTIGIRDPRALAECRMLYENRD